MRTSRPMLLSSLVVVTVLLTAACAQDSGGDPDDAAPPDGTGHLMAGYLRTPADEGRFPAAPAPVRAQLVALANGCVAVVVDGVERIPIWPDGTTVAQDADDFDRYDVTLPDGAVLVATSSGGDEFTADGVVDDSEPVVDPAEPPSVVAMTLEFCGLDAAPILFADADTFTTTR